MSKLIAIGIVTGIATSACQSVGLTLQRKSHLLEDAEGKGRRPWRRKRWIVGMSMFLVANLLGSSVQITTLPFVVLSPIQASGLVFNSICASLLLQEPFTRYSLAGTVLVSIGAGLVAGFGALGEPSHSLTELIWLFGQPHFIVWMAMQGALLLILMIMTSSRWIRPGFYKGLLYGCLSGIISAHCLLLGKSAVELLVRTIVDKRNQFDRWPSWCILVCLVIFALSQLYYLQFALKSVSTSVLYPLVFCIYNITCILDGLIYYRQARRMSYLHIGLVGLGTVLLLAGVFSLSWRISHEARNDALPSYVAASSAGLPGLGVIDEASSSVAPEFVQRIWAEREISEILGELEDNERTPLIKESRPRRPRRISRPEFPFPSHNKKEDRHPWYHRIWKKSQGRGWVI